MSSVGYVDLIKVSLFKVTSDTFIKSIYYVARDLSLYVGSSLSMLGMAV